jgi:hypothetical protein
MNDPSDDPRGQSENAQKPSPTTTSSKVRFKPRGFRLTHLPCAAEGLQATAQGLREMS